MNRVLTYAFFTTARRKYKMKLNFSLDKLELYLDDDILLESESLINAQKLISVTEVEKNLFLARFTGGGDLIETEVQLVGSKVKTLTCECNNFHEKSICPHVGAMLLTLLEQRKTKNEAKKIAAKPTTTSSSDTATKLTIPNILKRIEPSLLIEFIADYARADKQFALALKTRFAGDLSSGTIESHYKTLIDNTLKNAKNPKGRVTPKGWQQVFTLVDELRQKAEAFFKSGELSAAFELIKLTLPLVHRLIRPSDAPKVKLERRQVLLTEILRGFSELKISPELSQEIWDFLLLEYAQNVRHEFSIRLFGWLLKNADSTTRVENLLQTIDNQIIVCRQFLEAKDRLLTQKVQVLQKSGRTEEASALILSVSSNPEVLLYAVENAMASGDFDLAKSLSLNGLQIFRNNEVATQHLDECLLNIAESQSDTEGALFFAEKRLLSTWAFTFYQRLKKLGITSKKLQQTIEKIEKQPYRIEKRDLLAAIYIEEKQLVKLTDMILTMQSLDLLRRYGVDLYQFDREHKGENAVALHKKVIYEYLFTHLGRPPAQRIRQVLESLIAQNGRALAERLKLEIKKDFPERYSLNEELELMMDELDRQALLVK